MYVPSKTEAVARLFFIVSCAGLLMYILLAFYTFHTAYSSMYRLQNYQEHVQGLPNMDIELKNDKYQDLKYILLWTSENNSLKLIGEGQMPLISRNCLHTNCYLTSDRFFLRDYIHFESIIFDSRDLHNWKNIKFPERRSDHQKYIFHSEISSNYTPVCNVIADSYFNWTWTYKLDSDIVSPFIEVKDLEGNVIAPSASVDWESNMTDLPKEQLEFVKEKKKAMVWIVTKCTSITDRIRFAKMLRSLFITNSLVFNIYGCGNLKCPKEGCLSVVKEYYFYFAAEDTNSVDYVTQDIVTAFDNYAVPIVLGGANYTRFLPPGSYINTRSTSVDQLIELIQYVTNNPSVYNHYHRWRKYYTITKAERFTGICEICAYLNDDSKFGITSVKEDFRQWWFPDLLFERCIPKEDDDSLMVHEASSSQPIDNEIKEEQSKSDVEHKSI